MTPNDLAGAIESLRPGAPWTLHGTDVTTIIWHTPGVQPLTQPEVEAEAARLQLDAEKGGAA